MSAIDNILAILLIALVAHVGILTVAIARAAVPTRRDPTQRTGLAAAGLALLGELLTLGTLIGWQPDPLWVIGLLALATLLALLARPTWNQHAAGRAARQALYAAPLVLATILTLTIR